jgi:protocatechuate 3,4-dioxygenase beta subunit
VVSGIVLEQISGVPLARSRVRLDRIDNTGRVQSHSVIAGRTGQFTFTSVPDGLYVLTASREGYASIAYGQRRPQGTGPSFAVNNDTNLFAEMRLRRLGVLTGRVLDENRVGIRRVGVSAYSASPPFRTVGNAETDDRGLFRIYGLPEGKYRVRSQPFRHDDGLSMLPTFGPETLLLRDSTVYLTRLDYETTDLDLAPIPGNLISVGGMVTCASLTGMTGPITVTLSSDTGRREARTACNGTYRFDNLAPGNFELLGIDAESKIAAFQERQIYQTSLNTHLELRPIPAPELFVRDESGRMPVRERLTLTLRRVDAAGVVETRTLVIDEHAAVTMAPGWWELTGRMAAPYHLTGSNLSYRLTEPRPTAHPDWFEVQVADRYGSILLRTSNQAGSIAGKVTEQQKGVPGIPVFLWPVAPESRRRAGGPHAVSSNAAGEFRFEGLPPGDYRLVASFDYDEVDADVLAAANAATVTVTASAVARAELTPYLAP